MGAEEFSELLTSVYRDAMGRQTSIQFHRGRLFVFVEKGRHLTLAALGLGERPLKVAAGDVTAILVNGKRSSYIVPFQLPSQPDFPVVDFESEKEINRRISPALRSELAALERPFRRQSKRLSDDAEIGALAKPILERILN